MKFRTSSVYCVHLFPGDSDSVWLTSLDYSLSCMLQDGMNATNTLHVDSFLYPNEEDVDSLCESLEISRNHCLNCGSWKTAPLSESLWPTRLTGFSPVALEGRMLLLFGKLIMMVTIKAGRMFYELEPIIPMHMHARP